MEVYWKHIYKYTYCWKSHLKWVKTGKNLIFFDAPLHGMRKVGPGSNCGRERKIPNRKYNIQNKNKKTKYKIQKGLWILLYYGWRKVAKKKSKNRTYKKSFHPSTSMCGWLEAERVTVAGRDTPLPSSSPLLWQIRFISIWFWFIWIYNYIFDKIANDICIFLQNMSSTN